MGQVIVRNLDDAVIAAHKARAKTRGVSLEQQLRDVLAEAARPSREDMTTTKDVPVARRAATRGTAGRAWIAAVAGIAEASRSDSSACW